MPNFSKNRVDFRLLLILLFVACNACGGAVFAEPQYRLPVRVIAGADVLQVRFEEYAVREFLDLHNDYIGTDITVYAVTADTWVGHRRDGTEEDWREFREPLKVPGGQTVRVAERQRIVVGKPLRNHWVRWIRFTVTTSVGPFVSNFICSPLKRPGVPISILPSGNVDSLSHPRPPGRYTPRSEE